MVAAITNYLRLQHLLQTYALSEYLLDETKRIFEDSKKELMSLTEMINDLIDDKLVMNYGVYEYVLNKGIFVLDKLQSGYYMVELEIETEHSQKKKAKKVNSQGKPCEAKRLSV